MDGDLSSAKKQKRLDLLGAKLSIRAQAAQALSNGSLTSIRASAAGATGICLECGGAAVGAEICSSCSGGNRTQVPNGPGLVCPACNIIVLSASAGRFCTACKNMVHHECDRSEPSATGFVCISCRKSPLVGDVMLGSRDPISPLHTEAPQIPNLQTIQAAQSALLVEAMANTAAAATLNPFTSAALQSVVGDFHDMYHHHMSGDISSPATTSDSARNSPFYPENSPSDIDEDFVPGRGRGGKKKPGRGVMKTRSGGKPPNGSFLDKVGASQRGKRGKRGANKNGKGPSNQGTRGRGRGRPSPSMNLQPVTTHALLHHLMAGGAGGAAAVPQQLQPQLPLVREVDETLMEETRSTDRSGGEDPEYVRTIVVCDASDQFLQKASLCLVCGSVGKGGESSMVACSNCAQTYHTYCVGLHDKMNQTVVTRGWRCLDCTVCEGCGEGKDESKLLLCEECDVSYHIYCLQPPLEKIPNGPWRCHWCAQCRRCNRRVSSGTELTREGLCTTCHSLRKCPKCAKLYQVGEKIIRCSACLRWYHGTCEDLYNDEMLESASQNKMRCSACRPSARNFGNIMSFEGHANLVVCDNVALNKTADEILQSKFMPSLFRQDSFGSMGYSSGSFDHYGSIDDDYLMSEDYEMITSSGRGRGMGRGGGPGRKVPKLGVGGFFVKIPRHRVLPTDEELDDDGNKKQKRPRKPRRSQLEDAYPPAIQEGFFGMRPVEGKNLLDARVEEPRLAGEVNNGKRANAVVGHELSHEATEQLRNDLTEADILENMDLGDINMEDMDFSNWMDDDDDDADFGDTLNDAMDLIKTEEGETKPSTSAGMSQHEQHQQQQLDVKPVITHAQQAAAAAAASASHSSSSNYSMPATISRTKSLAEGKEERQTAERSEIARWEEDEPLGHQATKAAVLYANVRHPELKEKYPEWSERVKHIQRFWRTLDSESRSEFVNKARENRANRGKQPRVRKVASSQSMDSPTIQSPAPTVMFRHGMMDERFKVPNMPMGMPGTSQMRPEFFQQGQMQQVNPEPQMRQIKVTNHLSPTDRDQYTLLLRRSEDLRKHQEVLEQELAKMRKQKKNLTAKKRQLQKNLPIDGEGKPVGMVELTGPDRENLDELPNRINLKSKDLEQCKREIKQHSASLSDFETKHNIIRTIPANTPEHELIRMQQMNMNPHVGVPVGAHPMGVPVPHPAQGGAPVFPHQPMGQHPQMHPQFQQMRVPQQVPYGMQPMPMQMRPQQLRPMRTPVLGGKVYERLQTQLEREIYEVVDDMVARVHMMLEPPEHRGVLPEEAGQSGMLKRLLEPGTSHNLAVLNPTPAGLVGGGAGSHLMDLEPPRAKKKRTQPKKAVQPGMAGNEYELMVERVETQLRLIQQLPKQALEPAPRNPGASFVAMGITDLYDRPNALLPDRRATEGYILGQMNLKFVEDYFKGGERGPQGALANVPSAAELVCPPPHGGQCQQIINNLKHVTMPEEEEIVQDKEDAHFGLFDPMSVIIKATGRYALTNHLRVVAKILDVQQPLEPHRSVFHQERDTVEEVEISMVIRADPNNVISSVQKMLELGQAISYEMDTPPMSPEARMEPEIPSHSKKDDNPSPAMGGKCRGCDAPMHTAPVQSSMSQLGLTPSDDDKDDSVCFCSMKCYYRFVAQSKVALHPDQLNAAEQHIDEETMATLRQISAESFAKHMTQGKTINTVPILPSDALLTSPRDTRYVIHEGSKDNVKIIRVADLAALQEVSAKREVNTGPSEDWMTFTTQTRDTYTRIQAQKQEMIMSPKMGVSLNMYSDLDQRVCVFCGGKGDGEPSLHGRLLNLCANIWVHVNCALWSAEVYETTNGGLLQVDQAVVRASHQQCHLCGRCGASIQCHKAECGLHFHLNCAKNIKGHFVRDKTFFCSRHPDVTKELVTHLDAPRRIYIERNETALLSKLFDQDGPRLCMKLGALTFFKAGQLLPEQLKNFHSAKYIYPNGYTVSRWFWSPTNIGERVLYECRVGEREQKPWFTVSLGQNKWEADTATGAWKEVMQALRALRLQTDILKFFCHPEQGETLFGLGESSITKITESLPGVDTLFTYNFRHPNGPLLELPLAENPSGCARAEPRFRTLIKHRPRPCPTAAVPPIARNVPCSSGTTEGRTRGQARTSSFDELAQAQLKLMASGGATGDWAMILSNKYDVMANNSTYSLYMKMKRDIDNTVYLARSKIQGLGLFAKRDINMGDMIVEYKGEIIRNEVCNVREKKYVAQNRGVYMFRIDEEIAVDATMAGGLARYINHSCDPNCSTKVIAAGPAIEDKKIVITANRPIKAREELTYDYQFELEDDSTKIPCLCGAPNCVKWMN